VALNAYTAGRTAQQIVAQAEQTCGHPGLHQVSGTEGITAPAYVQLNEILTSLYTQHEWPFLASATNVVISARENSLPLDYWRARFVEPLVLIDGDSRITLMLLAPEAFYHSGLSSTTATGRPTRFTIDKQRSSFFVDCLPDRSYNAELHYYKYVARLTAITDVPLFPDSQQLIQMLCAWYYQRDNDPERWQIAKAENVEAIARIKASLTEDSDGGNDLLDPRTFRTPDYDAW
jgi:hypothetical protein